MGLHIPSGKFFGLSLALTTASLFAQAPQGFTGSCTVSAVPTQIRSEGLTELTGDILFQCTPANGLSAIAGNLSLFYPVQVTNRVDSNGNAVDAQLLVSAGGGFFTSSGIPGKIQGGNLTFLGLNVPSSANGVALKVTGVRVNARQFPSGAATPMNVNISSQFVASPSTVTIAQAQPGLYSLGNDTSITCVGSALPATVTLPNLFAAKTAFASTRITEGFASSFRSRGANEDSGTRFLLTYSGFPAGTQLYLPDFVAGSDALTPTAGGDLGLPQAAGQYVPGSTSLLLARVQFADSTGAGGQIGGFPSSGPSSLYTVSSVPLTNGAGYAVYEVIDANPNSIESAQFPVFFGVPANSTPATATETLSFAPVSTVGTASTSAPVPRFASSIPTSDCSIVGDCGAGYFPKLSVSGYLLNLNAFAGGLGTGGAIAIQNAGGGIMNWSATVQYVSGSGWLKLFPDSGQNNGTVNISGSAVSLAAGTYQANILIDGGPLGGTATLPVTFTVGTPTNPAGTGGSAGTTGSGGSGGTGGTVTSTPTPAVTSVDNAASLADAPVVAGSLSTIIGSNFAGKTVAVTFDNEAATLLYTGATQINLMVPADIAAKASTQMVVTVDGIASPAKTLQVSPAWPGIFAGGVLNQDNAVNSSTASADPGSIIQIFATGIPDGATVTALIGNQKNLVPLYAGPAPGIPGVQQVNIAIPAGAASGSTPLALCATASGQSYCSTGFALNVR